MANATELGITQKALMTWWQNQRTKYDRLKCSVGASGSGRKEDSEQEMWCRSFQFLGRFVARTLVKRGVDLQARMRQRYPEMAQPETETQTESETKGDDEVDSTAGATETTAPASTTATHMKKRKQSKSEESPYVPELQEVIKRSAELQAQVATQMAGGSDIYSRERHKWGAWMSSSMQQIHDSLWQRLEGRARFSRVWDTFAPYSSPSVQYLPAWQHQYQDPTVNPKHVVGMLTRPAQPSSAFWGRLPSAIGGAPPPSPAPRPCMSMSAQVTQPPVQLPHVTMPEVTRSLSAAHVTSPSVPESYTVVDTHPISAASNISFAVNSSEFADQDISTVDK